MKHGKNDIINKIFFTLVFVLMFLASCVFLPFPGSENKGAVYADLLFALSIVTGVLYENSRSASVIALIFGVISDVFITPPMHLSPILFFFAAYYAPKVISVFTSVNAATSAVASIPFFLIRAVIGCVYIISENQEAGFTYVIKNIILPELAFNVTAVFIIYIIVGFVYKKVKRRFYI